MTNLPVTESETIHARQDMLETQLEHVEMRQVGVFIRGVLGGLVLQARRFVDLYDQVQEMQRTLEGLQRKSYQTPEDYARRQQETGEEE